MRYRVLGPVTVIGQSGPVQPGGPKQAALLAVLLLNANRVVAETRMIELVWGDRPPPSVRGRIHVYVSQLRKVVGRDVISRRPSGYVIEVAPGELDLDLFDQAVARARGGGRDAVEQLRYALSLWDGQALAGVTEALADSAGPALAERRLAVLDELYELELAAGRHAEAVGELRDAVGQYPLSERLRGHLMLALHRSGRTAEALQVYAETRTRLAEELGIDPGQRLQDLRTQILTGQDEAVAPALPRVRPAELPLDARGFAGRAAELATLSAAPHGIWVISGTAGAGKTALAVHWAHTVRARFPDGQLHVNLRGFEQDTEPVAPAAALAQLVRALGVDPGEMPTELDDLARLYRSLLADREVLVLLDNARDAGQVMPLLPSSGLVLITSRHRLGDVVARAGARALPLGMLPPADSAALLTAVLGAEAVAAEPEAAEELARLCGHHALALRVAAANVSTRIAGVVAELRKGSSLEQLTVDGAEEGAVTAAFALSYQALAPPLQRMFRMLGLIPGPDFTAEAAAELTGTETRQAGRQLKMLAAANLVEPYTPDRYRFHDLVRQYAYGRAMADETRTEAWNRLFAYYLAAADAFARLLGPKIVSLPREPVAGGVPDISRSEPEFADVSEGLAWLDPELPNLIAALRLAAAEGPYPMAWYLADSLRRIVHDHGRRAEWLEIAPAVLRAAARRGQDQVGALLHLSLGSAYFREGRHEQGIHHTAEAVQASRACGWRECEATATANLSSLMGWTGLLTDAVGHGRQAVLLFHQIGAKSGQCLALNTLGSHYRHLGWLDEAADCLAEAVTLAQAERLVFWEAAGLADHGHILLSMGRMTHAQEALLRSRSLFELSGSSYGLSIAFSGLSQLRIAEGDHPQARLDAVRAVELARQDGDKVAEATALIALGNAQAELEMWRTAEESHRLALDITTRSGLRWQRAEASAGLARDLANLRRADEAHAHGVEALEVAVQGKFVLIEATIRIAIAEVHLSAGRQAAAIEQAVTAREIWLATGHVTGEATAQRFLDRLTATRAS